MGLLSHRVERSDIVAGDHIYSWRTSFVYSHHGIYVGENIVVHFTNDVPISKSKKSNDGSSFITCTSSSAIASTKFHSTCAITKLQTTCPNPKCGFRSKQDSGVKISCLDCFLGNGSLYLYQYGVAWYHHIAKIRGGTCTTAKSDPPEIVVRRAMYLLDHGFGEYEIIGNNCEDFALYCKTGRLMITGSGQVSSFLGVPTIAAAGFFFSGPVALATAAATYSFRKYSAESCFRDHGVEVPVEELAKFRANGNRPVKKE